MPVCARRKYEHCSENRHYSAYRHCSLFLSVPNDSTCTIAGNRHYSTGAIEGPLLRVTINSFVVTVHETLILCRSPDGRCIFHPCFFPTYFVFRIPASTARRAKLFRCARKIHSRCIYGKTAPADLEPPEGLRLGLGLGRGSGWSGHHARRAVPTCAYSREPP